MLLSLRTVIKLDKGKEPCPAISIFKVIFLLQAVKGKRCFCETLDSLIIKALIMDEKKGSTILNILLQVKSYKNI